MFSVVSGVIYDAEFVATPAGMQALMKVAHTDIAKQPQFSFKVDVVHDWVEYFRPFIKKGVVSTCSF